MSNDSTTVSHEPKESTTVNKMKPENEKKLDKNKKPVDKEKKPDKKAPTPSTAKVGDTIKKTLPSKVVPLSVDKKPKKKCESDSKPTKRKDKPKPLQ